MEAVFIMLRCQPPKNQRYSSHVLKAVIPVGRVCQCALFRDDTDGRVVGGDNDSFDVIQAVFYLGMKYDRCFRRCLSMELGREGNLEQNVFHHVGAKSLG